MSEIMIYQPNGTEVGLMNLQEAISRRNYLQEKVNELQDDVEELKITLEYYTYSINKAQESVAQNLKGNSNSSLNVTEI